MIAEKKLQSASKVTPNNHSSMLKKRASLNLTGCYSGLWKHLLLLEGHIVKQGVLRRTTLIVYRLQVY